MTSENDDKRPFLMASLKEAQDTVRAYDTKAQIVGVGYIFAINIVLMLGRGVDNVPDMTVLTVVLAWLVFILPIVLFGSVLYPTRKLSPKLGEKGGGAKGLFYVEPDRVETVDAYLADVTESDREKELAYEILKTAALREIKRRRFLRALWAAAIGFAVLFLGQLARVQDFLPL